MKKIRHCYNNNPEFIKQLSDDNTLCVAFGDIYLRIYITIESKMPGYLTTMRLDRYLNMLKAKIAIALTMN